MGRTIRSKLMAAKRRHLIPVFDQYVGAALLGHAHDDWWEGWQRAMTGANGENLRAMVGEVRQEAGVPRSVPALRVLDVVIWMRVHGWKDDPTHLGPMGFNRPLQRPASASPPQTGGAELDHGGAGDGAP